jgi:tetratricopeptide (TPR) repeat protein
MRRALVVSLLLSLAAPALVLAQGAYGRLFGTVVDTDGKPLEGVAVSLEIAGTDAVLEDVTDKKGKFKLAVVDATKVLTLRLKKEGYQTRTEEIKIPIGQIIQAQYGMEREGTGSNIELPGKVEGAQKAVLVFNEGVKAFNEGDKATALLKFEEARGLDPSIKEVYEVLSTLYLEANRTADAATAASTLLGIDPNNRVALETQFSVAETTGDRAEASRLADVLIQQYPGESASLIAFNAGILASRAKDLPGAQHFFSAAVAMNPGLMPAKVGLARVLHEQGNDEQAMTYADEIIAAEPDNTTAWNIRYEVYKKRGDKAKADEAYAKLFSANPEQAAEVMFEDGKNAWEGGNAERAVTVLTRLLELQPNHPRAHYILGLASVSSGKIAEAKKLFARFIELAPNDPEVATAKEMLAAL